jgi:hypothetical protein
MNPTSLLLIDDDPAYCLQKEAAKAYRIDILYHNNLEEGMAVLESSRRIKAVILDGRCLLEPCQKSAARTNFVFHAMQQISDIENTYNRLIPCCVNTEQPTDFIEDLDGITQVFQKFEQNNALFDWLKNAIAQLPDTLIRKRYDDIFEKTSSHFTEEEEELLLDVLQTAHLSDPSRIITNLALLRRLLERLVDIACTVKLKKQLHEFTVGHGSRTKRILDAMNQNVLPSDLYVSANQLYVTCSKYGNHQGLKTNGATFKPGRYSVQRLVFAYLELLDYLLSAKT